MAVRLDTVDWLTAQLPVNSEFQVITFNTEAKLCWRVLKVSGWKSPTPQNWKPSARHYASNCRRAAPACITLSVPWPRSPAHPIISFCDRRPAHSGARAPRGSRVDGNERLKLFREAIRQLPRACLSTRFSFPEGDLRSSEYW